jgi:hypothetical protein
MNQNIFCSKCHRIPSQCCCSSAKELTDEEIQEIGKPFLGYVTFDELDFARAILKKASEK